MQPILCFHCDDMCRVDPHCQEHCVNMTSEVGRGIGVRHVSSQRRRRLAGNRPFRPKSPEYNVNGHIAQQADAANAANSVRSKTEANDDHPSEGNTPYRIGIISINAGEAVLYDLACTSWLKAARFVSLDTRQTSLPTGTDVVLVKLGEWIPQSIGHRVIRKLSLEQSRDVSSAAAGLSVVFIVVALGQPYELENALMIAEALRALRIVTFAVAILPFAHSKYPPLEVAIEDFKRLSQCLVTFGISQEGLLQHRIKGQDVGSSGNRSDELSTQLTCVANDDVPGSAERIICAVLAPEICESTVRYDLADLMATFDGCGGISFGFGSSDRAEGLVRAVDRAFTHPLLGSDALVNLSGIVVVVESRTRGEKMWIVREAMSLVKDVVGDRCRVIFSWSIDPDLPTDYRVSLMVGHADSMIANSREDVGNSVSIVSAGAQLSLNVSAAELDAAATLIQTAFQPGAAINGPVSFLQRHMRIGYQKASAIVEHLECAGVIASTAGGSDLFSHRRGK